MEEATENGKESSHSAHANGMKKLIIIIIYRYGKYCSVKLEA
jgi:hypothetical protein